MMISKFFNDINLNKEDRRYLIFLFGFAVVLTVVMIHFNQSRGAFNSDIFRYLPAALDFAGLNYNHISDPSWMYNSPVIFYLTSILFRLGYVNITSIFIVTGIFGIIGIFGMYTFLKIRFSPLLSFTGTLLYSSFSLTLFYFANGMLDTSAVAMLLWTIVFVVAAVNKNYKYYCLVAISFLISIFIRFTNTYMISLIVLYMLKDYDFVNLVECLFKDRKEFKNKIISFLYSSEFKWMAFSLVIGVIVVSYVFYVLLSYGSEIGYINMASSSLSHFHNPNDYNYVSDRLFYLKNLLSLLFSEKITSVGMIEKFNNPSYLAYLIFSVFIVGILLKAANLIKNREFFKSNKSNIEFRSKKSSIVLISLSVVFLVGSVLVVDYSYLLSLFLIWLVSIIIMSIMKAYPINQNNFTLALLCLDLFIFYMIIFSLMDMKCVRYILPTFPAITFFIIYSLESILKFVSHWWDDEKVLIDECKGTYSLNPQTNLKKNISRLIPIIFVVIFLFTAFSFTNIVEIDNIGLEIDSVSNYLIKYDKNYQDKEIGVKSGEMFYEWYFQRKVDVVDVDNLNSTNYSYIITWSKLDNDNYHKIYRSGGTILYEKLPESGG